MYLFLPSLRQLRGEGFSCAVPLMQVARPLPVFSVRLWPGVGSAGAPARFYKRVQVLLRVSDTARSYLHEARALTGDAPFFQRRSRMANMFSGSRCTQNAI
jgi:hypothetical protein